MDSKTIFFYIPNCLGQSIVPFFLQNCLCVKHRFEQAERNDAKIHKISTTTNILNYFIKLDAKIKIPTITLVKEAKSTMPADISFAISTIFE